MCVFVSLHEAIRRKKQVQMFSQKPLGKLCTKQCMLFETMMWHVTISLLSGLGTGAMLHSSLLLLGRGPAWVWTTQHSCLPPSSGHAQPGHSGKPYLHKWVLQPTVESALS